jgi:hypothetical protein
MVFFFSAVVLFYALVAPLVHFHIKWWTQPYRYPEFGSGVGVTEALVLIFCGVPLLMGFGVLLFSLWLSVTNFLVGALNLNSTHRDPGNQAAIKFFGGLFLTILSLGLFALPILG